MAELEQLVARMEAGELPLEAQARLLRLLTPIAKLTTAKQAVSVTSEVLECFGGVPAALVPDQLKSGVARSCWYDPKIQRTYEAMAEHYGTTVMPARPGKPRDKAKVEGGVLTMSAL